MATLYKRKNRFWVSYWIQGKQFQKSLGTDNERVARQKLKQVEYELSLGQMQGISRLFKPFGRRSYWAVGTEMAPRPKG